MSPAQRDLFVAPATLAPPSIAGRPRSTRDQLLRTMRTELLSETPTSLTLRFLMSGEVWRWDRLTGSDLFEEAERLSTPPPSTPQPNPRS